MIPDRLGATDRAEPIRGRTRPSALLTWHFVAGPTLASRGRPRTGIVAFERGGSPDGVARTGSTI